MEQQTRLPNSMATAGFVLALIAFFVGWIPFLGWIVWLLGLIFSAVGLSRANSYGTGKGLSIAGLIISLIGVIFLIVMAGAFASVAAVAG